MKKIKRQLYKISSPFKPKSEHFFVDENSASKFMAEIGVYPLP